MSRTAVCAAVLAAATPAFALADTIAAEFLGPGNGQAGSAGTANRFGQSFRSLTSGTVSEIDLRLRRNGADPATVIVTLFETDPNGLPSGDPIGAGSLPVVLTPDFEWYTIDFTGAGASLDSGVTYAFMVSSHSGDGGYLLETARPGGYADGEGLVSIANSPIEPMGDNFIYGDRDLLFVVRVADDCAPDVTGDGNLDTNDFFAFLALYQAQDPAADFSPDGQINTNDFFAFLAAYQAGC